MGVMGSLSPTSRAAPNTLAVTGFAPEFSLQFGSKLPFSGGLVFFRKGTIRWWYAFEAVSTVQSLGGRQWRTMRRSRACPHRRKVGSSSRSAR